MGRKAVGAIQSMFDRLGIAKRFGKKIDRFEAGGVVFEDQSRLDADLVLFLPAGEGHPVVKSSDLPRNDAGFVQIDDGCAVPGFTGVWAIGDAAALQGPDWRAKQGHVAEVMARVVATNVQAFEAGRSERESYLPHLGITCLLDMERRRLRPSRQRQGADGPAARGRPLDEAGLGRLLQGVEAQAGPAAPGDVSAMKRPSVPGGEHMELLPAWTCPYSQRGRIAIAERASFPRTP